MKVKTKEELQTYFFFVFTDFEKYFDLERFFGCKRSAKCFIVD